MIVSNQVTTGYDFFFMLVLAACVSGGCSDQVQYLATDVGCEDGYEHFYDYFQYAFQFHAYNNVHKSVNFFGS